MKFKIRFADQIVGVFIILSLAVVIFTVVMLGRSQRWFKKDVDFKTVLQSAGGLSKNMAVQYKGFTIGNIKDFRLRTEDDNVEVIFIIREEYRERVKEGSLMEVMINPIGLGNQFVFHPGKGEELPDGSVVPLVGSDEAKDLLRRGLTNELEHDDSIALLMKQVGAILESFVPITANLNEALGPGTDTTEIGRIIGSIQKTLAGAESLPQTVDVLLHNVNVMIRQLEAEITPTLATLNNLTTDLTSPDGLLYTVLDTDEAVYKGLVNSLNSVSSILNSLDKTTAALPNQVPQISGIMTELRGTLRTLEDVLEALTNNPLLNRGIPTRPESRTTGPRDVRF